MFNFNSRNSKSLSAGDSNFIFTYGDVGAGKSTFTASICEYINNKEDVILRKNMKGNVEGTKVLIKDWIEGLQGNLFPPRSLPGEFIEIQVGIQSLNDESQEILPITFFEVSGEDLTSIDLRSDTQIPEDGGAGSLDDKIVTFLKKSKICFLISSFEDAKENDMLFDQFIERLIDYKFKGAIALIISKWDLCKEAVSIEELVNSKMKSTRKLLSLKKKFRETAIFPFSIGIAENGSIKELDLDEYCRPIVSWMYEELKG